MLKNRYRGILAMVLVIAAAIGSAWSYQETPWAAVVVFVFLCVLITTALHDAAVMEIEDWCCGVIFILAAAACVTMPQIGIVSRLIGIICVSVPMLGTALVIPDAFGGGDIKLMAAAGAFLGWKLTIVAAMLAFAGAGVWSAWLLVLKKKGRKDHFALGPFLCMGMAAALFFGKAIMQWYIGN